MKIEEVYKMIDTIIRSLKKSRQNKDYLTLMTSGFALLEYSPELINYSVDQESEYRKYEAKLSNEYEVIVIQGVTANAKGKRNTSSYCDTQAKATDYYKEWQRAKNFIELIYELVNMAKKLASGVDKELNAS